VIRVHTGGEFEMVFRVIPAIEDAVRNIFI
jgi:hypothetical protein